MKCVDCPNYKECVKTKDLRTARRHCSLALRPSDTKKTNFDRIKEMTVDEMAKFIPAWSYTGGCKCSGKSYVDCNDDCENCVKEWLESEVNENG